MIGKILHSTKKTPCSCPSHKACNESKKNKNNTPHIYVEGSKRLRVPIKITRYKENKPTIQFKEQKTITKKEPKRKEKGIKHKEEKSKLKIRAPLYSYYEDHPKRVKDKKGLYKQKPTLQYVENKNKTYEYDYIDTPKRKSRLSEWYQKRRARRELNTYYERERKREKKERLEREKVHRLKEKEFRRKINNSPKSKKKKKIFTKQQADSRYVSVKNYNRYDDISNRFVNCCYRVCCQFYCCLSAIILFSFVIIFLI